MKKAKLSTLAFTLLLFLAGLLPLHKAFAESQEGETNAVRISGLKANFVSVLSGAVQSETVQTSYGCAAICEGRMLAGFSSTGEILWQKALNARPKTYFSAGPKDMLCVVTGTSTVQLLSPTGLSLWKADAGSAVLEAPQFGFDGRVFARSRNGVACWGLNGIQKWRLTLTEQDASIPLVQLNDGSLLSFLTKKDNGSTVAQQISPFGELLLEVTFSGIVQNAYSCGEGVLLVFSDGSVGLCSSKGGSLNSEWRKPLLTGTIAKCLCTGDGKTTFVTSAASGSSRVTVISEKSGDPVSYYSTEVEAQKLIYASYTSYGLVLADQEKAVCTDSLGKLVYKADYSGEKQVQKVFATDEGYLALCKSDWSVSSYRMKQSVSAKERSYSAPEAKPYSDFYRPVSLLSYREKNPEEIVKVLEKGSYGALEAEILSYIATELSEIDSVWTASNQGRSGREAPWLLTHPAYCESILTAASLTGTALFQKTLSRLLTEVKDNELRLCLVRAAKNCAFDPDESMLKSLALILRENTDSRSALLLKEICDATLSICRYMGRPAYFRQGQEMLSILLYPSYDRKIRDYATQTLKRLAEMSI